MGDRVAAGRAAELLIVCEVLAAAPPAPPSPPVEPRMVFSAPEGVAPLAPDERLDNLVLDVIRCSTTELVIGGPFWNQGGFDRLDEVLIPALSQRQVQTTVVLHPASETHNDDLERWVGKLQAAGPVTVEWYAPTGYSMMHAKFAIADRRRGYLGTANLTSWGLARHVEAGLELLPGQCRRLLGFLDALRRSGHLCPSPPA